MRNSFLLSLFFALSFIFCGNVYGQSPELVKNIETAGKFTTAGTLGSLNNIVYFALNDPNVGTELFRSDGTSGGTSLFLDLNPGPNSSNPTNFTTVQRAGGNLLFFTAFSAASGQELWRTDGTEVGTFPIDIAVGTGNSFPTFLTRFGDKLLFAATKPGQGLEVFITDGTSVSTNQISMYAPGDASALFSSGGASTGFLVLNPESASRKAFYLGLDNNIPQFFSTQGTSGTTVKVTNLSPFSISTGSSAFVGNAAVGIYFNCEFDSLVSTELCRLDPATGNVTVAADVGAGPGVGSEPQDLAILGNKILFSARTTLTGRELYAATSGVVGAVPLGDLELGPNSLFNTFSFTARLRTVGNFTYFAPDGSDNNSSGIYATDGTPQGTKLILNNAFGGFNSPSAVFTGPGSRAYFQARTAENGNELYSSEGTAATTFLIADIFPGTGSGLNFGNAGFFNGVLYILGRTLENISLFISNGTSNGTAEIKKLVTPSNGSSSPQLNSLGNAGNKLLFTAITLEKSLEPYVTDGTEAGTQLLKDIEFGDRLSQPIRIASSGNKVVFRANSAQFGGELWITDGTPAGTTLIKDINPGGKSAIDAFTNFKNVNISDSVFLFAADTDAEGRELWRSDGTEAGTILVKDMNPGTGFGINSGGGGPAGIAFNGKAYFTGADAPNNFEPWISDGTSEGTKLLAELFPGISASNPEDYIVFQNKVFFTAGLPALGRQIISTDGTETGTAALTAISPPSGFAPRTLTVSGNKFYMLGFTAAIGAEPWVSDGTSTGTIPLGDLNPGGTANSFPSDFFFFNGKTYFVATNVTEGRELWVTDGTPEGTALFKDFEPGINSSNPNAFSEAGGKMYFMASVDGKTFLFESNGTPEGTTSVMQSFDSQATGSTQFFRGSLYFPGFTANLGTELYKIVLDACPDDPAKVNTGICGCGITETDNNSNGILDCKGSLELRALVSDFQKKLTKLKKAKNGVISKKQKKQIKELKTSLSAIQNFAASPTGVITTASGADIKTLTSNLAKLSKKAFKIKSAKFKASRKNALKSAASTLTELS